MPRPKKDVIKVNINLERKVKAQFDLLHHDPITDKVAYGALSDLVNRMLINYLHTVKNVDLSDLVGENHE